MNPLDEAIARHPAGKRRARPATNVVPLRDSSVNVIELNQFNANNARARHAYKDVPALTPLLVDQVQRAGVASVVQLTGLSETEVRDWVGEVPPKPRPSCGTWRGRRMHRAFNEMACDACLVAPDPVGDR